MTPTPVGYRRPGATPPASLRALHDPARSREQRVAIDMLAGVDEPDSRRDLRERYQAIIQRVWKEPDNCPICRANSWNLGDPIDVRIRAATSDAPSPGASSPRQVYGYLPLTCPVCGYTIFFHITTLDRVDP